MIKTYSKMAGRLAGLAAFLLWTTALVHAQFQGGGGGNRTGGGTIQRGTTAGGGGGGGGGRATGGSGASRQYYSNGTVGEAMITSDPETRQLIVITDEETSQFVSQVITNLDRPKPQVFIKVVFLEVTYNNSLDFGVEGGTTRLVNQDPSHLMASNIFGLTPPSSPASAGGLYSFAGKDYQVTLRAIGQATSTEVLSRPSIMARNNQQATITVGQTLPFITGSTVSALGQTVNTIQYQDVGIILRVTPFISSDEMVEMIVSPEISSLTATTVDIVAGVKAPVISKRAADTVVVTPDGKTVVIGGLMQNDKEKQESKVPLLGDIPWLGNLFKHKNKSDSKTELMIFLTPHIVHHPTQLVALSQEERDAAVLAPKAFAEDELERYLDRLPAKKATPAPSRKSKFPPKGQ